MTGPELGLGFQSNKRSADYVRLAQIAERGGIDVLSVYGDLMFQPPIAPLLTMARATERVRLGPACLNPYTLHPVEIAGQAAALDEASRGRSFLGLARGSWLGDLGIDQERSLTVLREAVAVIRHLLAGNTEGFVGSQFRLAPGLALRYERPDREIPLLIGAWGERTTAFAGEVASELKVGGSANSKLVPLVRERLRVGGERAGRDVRDVGIVLGAVTVVDDDRRAARARARTEVAMYLALVADLDPTVEVDPALLQELRRRVDAGDASAAGEIIPDEILDSFAFSGTPEDVAGQTEAIFAAGARRVDFGTPHGLTDEHGVELLAARVAAHFR